MELKEEELQDLAIHMNKRILDVLGQTLKLTDDTADKIKLSVLAGDAIMKMIGGIFIASKGLTVDSTVGPKSFPLAFMLLNALCLRNKEIDRILREQIMKDAFLTFLAGEVDGGSHSDGWTDVH